MVLWLVQCVVFCCHSLGQCSPCWLGLFPGLKIWTRSWSAVQWCPAAAWPWTPALHCTRPVTWPASPRTPAERVNHGVIAWVRDNTCDNVGGNLSEWERREVASFIFSFSASVVLECGLEERSGCLSEMWPASRAESKQNRNSVKLISW